MGDDGRWRRWLMDGGGGGWDRIEGADEASAERESSSQGTTTETTPAAAIGMKKEGLECAV